ncbi:MAG: hypothetical protein Ct9H300mP6_11270 [Gammaproteobacteria bacterium]|nr:MAG: hypothetical protein Ct9H300mP6_11270 [Gammaproteobacteria bacterium]
MVIRLIKGVLSEVLETTYAEVIQDQKLQPAGPPEVSVDQFVEAVISNTPQL